VQIGAMLGCGRTTWGDSGQAGARVEADPVSARLVSAGVFHLPAREIARGGRREESCRLRQTSERMDPATHILSLAAEAGGDTATTVLIYVMLAVLVACGGALIAVNTRKLMNDWPRMKPRHNVDVAFVQIYLGVVLLTLAWIIATDPSQKFREARSPVVVSPDAR
jgi:hypothetical protein